MKPLMISEMFYSIQGENPTAGIPMLFMRLTSCNLTCKGWSYEKDGVHYGCDTADIWRTGFKYKPEELIQVLEDKDWIDKLRMGARLNWTGGEPLLRQESIFTFMQVFEDRCKFLPEVEIETNCTIFPSPPLSRFTKRFNVSPKLSSAGDPEELRYRPEIIQHFAYMDTAMFKFVISKEEDIKEVFDRYILPFSIPRKRITFMPEGSTKEEIQEHSQWLVERCKDYVIRFSPRLQVSIWDRVVGV